MKVHQSECARYGPSHFQQMWISKGGFDESSPCVVHRRCNAFTLVIFPFFSDAVTDFHCSLSLTHHVHVSQKKKRNVLWKLFKSPPKGGRRDLPLGDRKCPCRLNDSNGFELDHETEMVHNYDFVPGNVTPISLDLRVFLRWCCSLCYLWCYGRCRLH